MIAGAAILALVAACSSSGSSGGGGGLASATSASGSGNTQVQAAIDRTKAASTRPTSIVGLTPLSKKPPAGKKIIFLECSTNQVCKTIGDGDEQAAKLLGWSISRISYDNSNPESVINAMNQAVTQKPDAIVITGVASSVYQPALANAKAAGIPVVTGSTQDDVGGMTGNGIIGLAGSPTSYIRASKTVVDWMIADSQGKAKVLFVTADAFPAIKAEVAADVDYLKASCSTCTEKVLRQSAADVGTNTPNNVVSALQADPSINYVYFGFGDLSRGAAPALQNAGIKAKIVGFAPVEENFQRLQDGEEYAWAGWSGLLIGWAQEDVLARYFTGGDMSVAKDEQLTATLYTKDSPAPNTSPIFPANYQDLYGKAWMLS